MSQRNRPSGPPENEPPSSVVLQHPIALKLKHKTLHYKGEAEAWLRSSDSFLTPLFDYAEKETGVKRINICAGIVTVITLILLYGEQWHAGFLSYLITFLYPVIASLKALVTREKVVDMINIHTKWLTYWVIFGILGLFEFFAASLMAVLPYYLLKTVLQLWLALPGDGNGSMIVYSRVLRPLAARVLNTDSGAEKDAASSYLREWETKIRTEITTELKAEQSKKEAELKAALSRQARELWRKESQLKAALSKKEKAEAMARTANILCILCTINQPVMMYRPCNHVSICEPCFASRSFLSGTSRTVCMTCRKSDVTMEKVFLP